MPTPTYTPLANITLSSSAASVTFSSISQAYRDLVLVVSATANTGNSYFMVTFNSDSGANYNMVVMQGNGSSASSATASSDTRHIVNNSFNITNTSSGQFVMNIQDFSATDKHKSSLWRYNKTDAIVLAAAGRWASTSAITSITITAFYNAYDVGSTFALYGIAA
jgi:hypothetical protein